MRSTKSKTWQEPLRIRLDKANRGPASIAAAGHGPRAAPPAAPALPADAPGDEPPKNVLLFDSDGYQPRRPTCLSAIRPSARLSRERWKAPIQIYDEGQDSFRIPNEKYEAELVSVLQTEI